MICEVCEKNPVTNTNKRGGYGICSYCLHRLPYRLRNILRNHDRCRNPERLIREAKEHLAKKNAKREIHFLSRG